MSFNKKYYKKSSDDCRSPCLGTKTHLIFQSYFYTQLVGLETTSSVNFKMDGKQKHLPLQRHRSFRHRKVGEE